MGDTTPQPGGPIIRERLVRQHLVNSRFDDPVDVVRTMGAMQAQDYGQSLWAIAARLREPSIAPVVAAVESGSILRTWPMRGTIHWVPARDAAWMVDLSAARTLHAARTRRAALEIDDQILDRADRALTEHLTDNRAVPRPEIMALWEAAGVSTGDQRGYHLLWTLAHRGRIAIGPMAGKQQTFVLLDEYVPDPVRSDAPAAAAKLAARYLTSHGPANVQDLAWWAGITLTAARAAVADAVTAGRVIAVEDAIGNREVFTGADVLDVDEADWSGVRLLAGFDEYYLGYKNRDDISRPDDARKIVPGSNGVFMPTVVVDGVVVGTWKRTITPKSIDIAITGFRPRFARVRDLHRAIEGYACAYDLPVGKVQID